MAKPWRVRYAGAKYHLAGKGNGWAVFLGREDYARFMEQFDAALPIVDAITPVPGGVGAVTTALMFSHTVAAAERGRKGYYGRAQE